MALAPVSAVWIPLSTLASTPAFDLPSAYSAAVMTLEATVTAPVLAHASALELAWVWEFA